MGAVAKCGGQRLACLDWRRSHVGGCPTWLVQGRLATRTEIERRHDIGGCGTGFYRSSASICPTSLCADPNASVSPSAPCPVCSHRLRGPPRWRPVRGRPVGVAGRMPVQGGRVPSSGRAAENPLVGRGTLGVRRGGGRGSPPTVDRESGG